MDLLYFSEDDENWDNLSDDFSDTEDLFVDSDMKDSNVWVPVETESIKYTVEYDSVNKSMIE